MRLDVVRVELTRLESEDGNLPADGGRFGPVIAVPGVDPLGQLVQPLVFVGIVDLGGRKTRPAELAFGMGLQVVAPLRVLASPVVRGEPDYVSGGTNGTVPLAVGTAGRWRRHEATRPFCRRETGPRRAAASRGPAHRRHSNRVVAAKIVLRDQIVIWLAQQHNCGSPQNYPHLLGRPKSAVSRSGICDPSHCQIRA